MELEIKEMMRDYYDEELNGEDLNERTNLIMMMASYRGIYERNNEMIMIREELDELKQNLTSQPLNYD